MLKAWSPAAGDNHQQVGECLMRTLIQLLNESIDGFIIIVKQKKLLEVEPS
jgi:hypothetical protein